MSAACPFCGDKPTTLDVRAAEAHGFNFVGCTTGKGNVSCLPYVICPGCGATGPIKPTIPQAIAAWNERSNS